jgi:hypothetical protein
LEVLRDPQPYLAPAFGQGMRSRISVKSGSVRSAEFRKVAKHLIPEWVQESLDVSRAPPSQIIAQLLN